MGDQSGKEKKFVEPSTSTAPPAPTSGPAEWTSKEDPDFMPAAKVARMSTPVIESDSDDNENENESENIVTPVIAPPPPVLPPPPPPSKSKKVNCCFHIYTL